VKAAKKILSLTLPVPTGQSPPTASSWARRSGPILGECRVHPSRKGLLSPRIHDEVVEAMEGAP